MLVRPLRLNGLALVLPVIHEDERGYFVESYNERAFREAGICHSFVQDNISFSLKGVLRGLHFQRQHTQAKLVRAIAGMIFEVAVDLRKESENFGAWESIILSEENKASLFIPEGFAHGFSVLSDYAITSYKCTDYYTPAAECGIVWNDPTLGIEWPELSIQKIISRKDRNLPFFDRNLEYF